MKQTPLFFFSLVLAIFINTPNVNSQEVPDTNSACLSSEILTNFGNFENVHIGYYGTTQNCLAYNVHAFKYKRTWFLIANQGMNLTYLVAKPPRVENQQVVSGSNYLFAGLGKAYLNKYAKFKKRRRVVKDIEIYGYYKFYKPGRKSVKGLLLLEYPELEIGPPWPFKWMAQKVEEVQSSAEGIIPEITQDPSSLIEAAEKSVEEAIPEIKIEVPELPLPNK